MTSTGTDTGALLDSLFGSDQSPREHRSSTIRVLVPTSFKRSPISSLTRRPEYTAVYTIVAYGSGIKSIIPSNSSNVMLGLFRVLRFALGRVTPSTGFLTSIWYLTADPR